MIWHSQPLNSVIEKLSADTENGLSTSEVERRFETYGANKIKTKKKKSLFRMFLSQLTDFMIIILFAAALISVVSTIISKEYDFIEPIVIIAIVIINAVIGVFQEYKAEQSLEALQNMTAPSATVLRNGVETKIAAAKLVPGDIISLEAGDYIPADARVIESINIRCDESTLTGEALPVDKYVDSQMEEITPLAERENMVYSGCAVVYGHGKALVTDTGMNTEVGKIATLIRKTEPSGTPLKSRLAKLGKTLSIIAIAICAIIFAIGVIEWIIERPADISLADKMLDLFTVSVSLAVAAIPEGLPAIVTVVLAFGVERMVKKHAIVRKLPAVEALGSASVICTDKTGTLTQNKMTVVSIYDGKDCTELDEHEIEDTAQLMLLRLSAICCNGKIVHSFAGDEHIGDPTETSMVKAAEKYLNLTKDEIDNIYPRLGEIPFDSDRKLMTTVNMIDGRYFAITKGAPEILLPLCNGDTSDALKANDMMAKDALRVIAVAAKPLAEAPGVPTSDELENGLSLMGLIGMMDLPRPEAYKSVEECKKAGIRTVMITGDNLISASAIARKLGILTKGQCAITGANLEQITDEELAENIERFSVFARVSPSDKIRIVNAWKANGNIVAMTGDGVNDAPALNAADIGCAMGKTGTDVAKGSAEIILTDDNFATIVTAVKEGRGIFDNIKKSVHFLLSCNLGEVLSVFLGMIIFGASPLAAVQLLWLNLITDSAPALALGLEPAEKNIMKRKPKKRADDILDKDLAIDSLWQGALFALITLIAYGIGGMTMAFCVLSLSQLIHAFDIRSSKSIIGTGFFKNKYMFLAFAVSLALLLVPMLVSPVGAIFSLKPMRSSLWIWSVLLSLAPFVFSEAEKLYKKYF